MKKIRKLIITTLLLALLAAFTDVPVLNHTVTAQAATIKLSSKTLTLEVGKTKKLTVTGTSKKVTWSSSKKAVATVTVTGKVTAKAAGKATITATVAGKKLTCAVTVKEAVNPYLKDAPFKAQEASMGNINLVMPADWTITPDTVTDTTLSAIIAPNDTSLNSSARIDISQNDGTTPDYETVKEQLTSKFTKDNFKQLWVTELDTDDVVISDLVQSDLKTSFGKVYKIEYKFTTSGATFSHIIYVAYVDNYSITLQVFDLDDLNLSSVADYVINSIIVK